MDGGQWLGGVVWCGGLVVGCWIVFFVFLCFFCETRAPNSDSYSPNQEDDEIYSPNQEDGEIYSPNQEDGEILFSESGRWRDSILQIRKTTDSSLTMSHTVGVGAR